MNRPGWLTRAALLAVPRDWRAGVERDLHDEHADGLVAATRALGIGARLRLARWLDGLSLARAPLLRDAGRDVRLALRGIVRRPAHSLALVATLAIGIGANTAIFSVFNWVLFRPMPGVERPQEMVTVRFVRSSSDGRFFVSYRDVADLRDAVPALSGLAASAPQSMNVVLAPGADPERVEGELVTANYFDVLGVTLGSGRRFVAAEERPGSETPPAIISDTFRRRAFAGRDVLGQPLSINGHAFTIVGVAPRAFHGRTLIASTDLWVPTGAHTFVMPLSGANLLTNRRATLFLEAVGRLRRGATVAQAEAQARAAAAAVPDYGGRRPGSHGSGIVPAVSPGIGLDQFATDRLATMWRLLTGAAGLMLLLACANAANLLLARALGRRREIAVCQAIGASRFRLVRQQCVEGLVLSLLAGCAGLLVALILTWAFDGMRLVSYLPAIEGVGVDGRVVVFTAAIAIATGVLFSLAPALASSRGDLQASLKDGLTSSRMGRGRLRAALAVVQVAVSVLLLVGAGLFARTLHNVRALDLGVNLDGRVTLFVDPTRAGYTGARATGYFQALLERVRAAPGVQAAAFVQSPPYSNTRSGTSFTRADGIDRTERDAENTSISSGYFTTLGVPLIAGRDFTDADYRHTDDGTADVVIVSERVAREAFPEGGALGSRLVLSYPKGKVVQIVGVAGNVRRRPVTKEAEPFMYMPGLASWGSVAVRSSWPFAQTAATIRAVARDVEPSLPPYDLEPMAAGLDQVISEERLLARFTGILASVAALLAAVGIYAVMAGAVAERRREFGIRIALGARPISVLTLVLRGAVQVALAGVVAGLAGSLAFGRVLASRLYGVRASDPLTLALVTASLASVALAASLVPALSASRADPVRSLRIE